MGMSASQARLLSLTARMSDLEFQAQSISNSKIRLADESEAASRDYSQALDKQKLTVSDGQGSYVDASAYNLTTYNAISTMDKQRFIKDAAGRLLVTTKVGNAFDNAANTEVTFDAPNVTGDNHTFTESSAELKATFDTVAEFLNSAIGYSNLDEYAEKNNVNIEDLTVAQKAQINNTITCYTNIYTGVEAFMQQMGYTSNPNDPNFDQGAVKHFTNLFNEIQESGGYNAPGDSNMKDPEWLQAELSAGSIFLVEWDSIGGTEGKGDFVDISWTSGDPSLQEKDDKTDLARAEAKYEATMANIQSKDKRFDLQLQAINTEHEAISIEIDTVKKVIDNNVKKSFKIFDA